MSCKKLQETRETCKDKSAYGGAKIMTRELKQEGFPYPQSQPCPSCHLISRERFYLFIIKHFLLALQDGPEFVPSSTALRGEIGGRVKHSWLLLPGAPGTTVPGLMGKSSAYHSCSITRYIEVFLSVQQWKGQFQTPPRNCHKTVTSELPIFLNVMLE